jgi:hypothetical protein
MSNADYRVWNDIGKCFIYFNTPQIDFDSDGKAIVSFKHCDFKGGVYLGGYHEAEQYTGLKDKNGVKIFEGDIVTGVDGLQEGYTATIEYRTEWGRMTVRENLTLTYGIAHTCCVIGNIHENPELLEPTHG